MADILRAEGFNFKAMEVKVKQLVVDEEVNRTLGGWHTEISLKALNWTESPALSWLHPFTTFRLFAISNWNTGPHSRAKHRKVNDLECKVLGTKSQLVPAKRGSWGR